MIKKSIRQLMRTPVKACLFFLLLTMAVLLLTLGGSLGVMTAENMQRFDRIFTTIGTVEQLPSGMFQDKTWDAEREDYRLGNRKVYAEALPLSVLDFEGAEYLSGPESRPVYISLHDSYQLFDNETPGAGGGSGMVIVEAQPLEDCVPAGPVKMKLVNTLYSCFQLNMPEFNYCDHYNENPEKLYANKTYIMALQSFLAHGWRTGGVVGSEYIPASGIATTQADAAGVRIPDALSENYIQEVTEGFYETEEGKQWLELAKAYEIYDHSIPVTPVSDLNLLMPFYNGDAYINEGRAFEETDYSEGKKVCLVSRYFAKNNKLSLGDEIPLSLVAACYGTPGWSYNGRWGLLDAKGDFYQPFEEAQYEIVGIYELMPGSTRYSDYSLQENEVLIPADAVTADISGNIAGYEPMKGYRTSFQIPNGSIADYQELWEKQEMEGLEIVFYDKGYTKLKESLDGIKKISAILLVTGAVTALLILVFFCYLFISKQSRRTAIERSLGMSKGRCMVSMMAGILLLSAAGSLTGSITGSRLTGTAVTRLESQEHYDRKYSDGVVSQEEAVIDASVNAAVPAVSGTAVFLLSVLIAYLMMRENLKKEPLKLLGDRE